MYTLVSTVVKTVDSDGRWESADIGNMPMSDIYTTFRQTVAILSNPFLPNNVSFNLDAVRKEQAGSSQTFNEYLASLGENSLPTSPTLPNLNVRYALYGDAFKSGYKVNPINELTSPDAELPLGAKDWLFLTRPNTDYALFGKTCMVTVNGFYHRTEANDQGIWVIDGMATARQARDNHIGITSFKNLGTLKVIPITDSMIYNQTADEQLGKRAYINLGEDLNEKTLMVVIGGYLHVLDHRVIYRVGDTSFCIEFENIPLLERFYESRDVIDLSSLELDTSDFNPSVVSPQQLYSDAAIRKYLQLSQSFVVLLDNKEIFVEYEALPATTLPGLYLSDIAPIWPVISGFGRTMNFWSTYEDGRWSISSGGTVRPNYLFKTALDYNTEQALSDSKDPTHRFLNDRLFHQKIGTNY